MGATAETPEARPCEKHIAVSLSDDTKPATFDHPQFSAAPVSSVFPAMPSNNSRQARKTVRYRTQLASDSHLFTLQSEYRKSRVPHRKFFDDQHSTFAASHWSIILVFNLSLSDIGSRSRIGQIVGTGCPSIDDTLCAWFECDFNFRLGIRLR